MACVSEASPKVLHQSSDCGVRPLSRNCGGSSGSGAGGGPVTTQAGSSDPVLSMATAPIRRRGFEAFMAPLDAGVVTALSQSASVLSQSVAALGFSNRLRQFEAAEGTFVALSSIP